MWIRTHSSTASAVCGKRRPRDPRLRRRGNDDLARALGGNANEWRYVSVRRVFNIIEESVNKSTSFAVLEPNGAEATCRDGTHHDPMKAYARFWRSHAHAPNLRSG